MLKIITFLLSFFYLLISCSNINIFEDSSTHSKEVELDSFTEIFFNANANISLSQANNNSVNLIGYAKQIEDTKITIIDSTLIIDENYKNYTKNYHPLEINLTLKELSKITCSKPCSLSSDTITGNSLYLDLQNIAQLVELNLQLQYNTLTFLANGSISGKFTFSGQCTTSNFSLNGLSSLNSLNLICDTVNIINYAAGDHFVYAKKKLTVTFHSESNIYYKGNPEISVSYKKVNSITPTGKLVKLD